MVIPQFGKSVFSVFVLALLVLAGLAPKLDDAMSPTVSPGSLATQGPSAPILLITAATNPFSGYYAEILLAEGLNAFHVTDIRQVTAATLARFDVAILGEMPVSDRQAAMLGEWVYNGGNLIAMRPDKKLAPLLGLLDASSKLSNAYLLVHTASGPGVGIVDQTIQFHGTADLYRLSDSTPLAKFYSNAVAATSFPAATIRGIGPKGGHAAAFAYDLARSIVYTRQGNPEWSARERDGLAPIRPNDLFFGAASGDPQMDWIDLNKVGIPQADEQQRLLANLIIQMNSAKKPLPRFWYFPRNLKAVVIMTGDDHGTGKTARRFDDYIVKSIEDCSVDNWECIRSTSYIYTGCLTRKQADYYNDAGFEIALHINTGCSNWTQSSLRAFYDTQIRRFVMFYGNLASPCTNRTHCIAWSDYDTQPQVEFESGIRFDTNYYYWPSNWISDRPGFFTGSSMPMRFARSDGTVIDVYQSATQMTDESGQTYPFTIDTLLDRAIGTEGFYGVFTVNAHTDITDVTVSDAVVASALAREVPVISARQMLKWLDGRNGSSLDVLSWDGTSLCFKINAGDGANGLRAMVPIVAGLMVSCISLNGTAIPYSLATIKGIRYAIFDAISGAYRVAFAQFCSKGTLLDSGKPLLPHLWGGDANVPSSGVVGAVPPRS